MKNRTMAGDLAGTTMLCALPMWTYSRSKPAWEGNSRRESMPSAFLESVGSLLRSRLVERRPTPRLRAPQKRLNGVAMQLCNCLVAMAAVCACPGVFAQNAGNLPWESYGEVVEAGRSVAPLNAGSLFGDSVDLYTGSLSFSQTDVSLPGNSALPVAIARKAARRMSARISEAAGDWTSQACMPSSRRMDTRIGAPRARRRPIAALSSPASSGVAIMLIYRAVGKCSWSTLSGQRLGQAGRIAG